MPIGGCNPIILQYNSSMATPRERICPSCGVALNFSFKVIFMKDFGSWMRTLGVRLQAGLSRFMSGRYGTDRLNMLILCVGVAASLLSAFLQRSWVGQVCWVLSYVLMIWAIFRCLSRNINKRYQENRRFLLMIDRVKDRKNRYFLCPRCRQTVRVPRGKGKILITCPKCKEKFQRKT